MQVLYFIQNHPFSGEGKDFTHTIAMFYNIVTIDGPVGVGKSAVAGNLAKRLGWRHIDTGAMYRAVTLAAMRRNIDLNDAEALTAIARTCNINLVYNGNNLIVYLDGEDVTEPIRDPEVSRNTSPVSETAGVREEMVALQRQLGMQGLSIMEGRDIGTVVFPDAFWKFYLDARLDERTHRRVLQLQSAGKFADYNETREAICQRDERDRSRSYGPLRVAPDAIIIDTTCLTEEEVIRLILTFVRTGNNEESTIRDFR